MVLLRWFLALLVCSMAMHARADDTVRQRRTVLVDGVREEWTLRWAGPVRPVCPASALAQAATCPCSGFAYGEQGQLFLDRERDGAAVETMALTTLFKDIDNPADQGNAALARWPRLPHDPSDDIADPGARKAFDIELGQRAQVDVLDVRDFARDGMQASFLLQVGNEPCGKQEAVLVGVSRRLPSLHVFATTAHPQRPLVLQRGAWLALLASDGQATFTDLACGDHGSDKQIEQTIDARDGLIAVQARTYACRQDGSRGLLLQNEAR